MPDPRREFQTNIRLATHTALGELFIPDECKNRQAGKLEVEFIWRGRYGGLGPRSHACHPEAAKSPAKDDSHRRPLHLHPATLAHASERTILLPSAHYFKIVIRAACILRIVIPTAARNLLSPPLAEMRLPHPSRARCGRVGNEQAGAVEPGRMCPRGAPGGPFGWEEKQPQRGRRAAAAGAI
jgi:hypothetical protein